MTRAEERRAEREQRYKESLAQGLNVLYTARFHDKKLKRLNKQQIAH